jgi:hypothetical protein
MPAAVPAVGIGVGIGVGALQQDSQPQQQAQGGYINPYMYYSGGPIDYKVGGKVWQGIGNTLYNAGAGLASTVSGGLTKPFTDKGQDYFQKLANPNFDPSNPDDVKAMRQIDTAGGAGQIAGAITGAIINPTKIGSAVATGTDGINDIIYASEASDDVKKWSQGISGVAQLGHMMNGSTGSSSSSSPSSGSDSANISEIGGQSSSAFGDILTNFSGTEFGKTAEKAMPFANQAMGALGDNKGSLLEQGYAEQKRLNSPEYLAMKELQNQDYVNQGMSFAAQGGHVNNEKYLVNLQNNSMRNRYNNYRQKYKDGGKLEGHGVVEIPSHVGLHKDHPRNGMQLGPDSLVEGKELIRYAEGGMMGLQGADYVYPADVDGEKNIKMPQMDSDYKVITDKYGLPRFSDKSPAQWLKEKLNRGSEFRTQVDSIGKKSGEQAMEIAEGGREMAASVNELKSQQLIEEEYIAAYGGRINPKKYPGLNRSKKSKGGYVYNAMTQPMLAQGGPTDPPSNNLISNDKVLGYIADMNERGMLEPGKTFQPSWYSDTEKRQVDLNKELSKVDLERVKSLYNYKQSNRNIFGFAQGGPMVSNVQQPFNGPAAQNRGGMMMANGGMMPGFDNDPLSQYEQLYDNRMEKLMNFNPDSSDLGEDILEENNLPFEYRIREPELTTIKSRTYPSSTIPGIIGNQEPMPGLSEDSNFISPYQKYLVENNPKILDKLNYDNFGEYTGYINPYGKDAKNSKNLNTTTPWYEEPAYSKIARYLPLATSAAGIATGLKNKKRTLTPERINAQRVDLERSRITAKEEGRRALDSTLRFLNTKGSNIAQVAGNARETLLNYIKNMGANIAKSYETEENANAQLAQQAGLANQQAGNQFKIGNEEMFQNAQTMALRAAQEGAMLAQSGAEQERKQYLQEWIAKNRLKTRNMVTGPDGEDYYYNPTTKKFSNLNTGEQFDSLI